MVRRKAGSIEAPTVDYSRDSHGYTDENEQQEKSHVHSQLRQALECLDEGRVGRCDQLLRQALDDESLTGAARQAVEDAIDVPIETYKRRLVESAVQRHKSFRCVRRKAFSLWDITKLLTMAEDYVAEAREMMVAHQLESPELEAVINDLNTMIAMIEDWALETEGRSTDLFMEQTPEPEEQPLDKRRRRRGREYGYKSLNLVW